MRKKREKPQLKVKSFLIFCFLFFSSCGGSEQSQPQVIAFQETQGDTGYIHLSLSNSLSSDASELGTITHYKIKIEGEGLETKEETLTSQAAGVAVQGIPAGKNRQITVSALNRWNQVLREGSLKDVTIESGKQAELKIALQAVPLVLNYQEGASVSNQRLFFSILTDVGHRVELRAENFSTTAETNAKGIAQFYFNPLSAGTHFFEMLDLDSGQSSQLSLRLWEGQAIRSAPLWAASSQKGTLGGVRWKD